MGSRSTRRARPELRVPVPRPFKRPAPHRRRDMGASWRRARAALAVVAFLAIFPRVAFAQQVDLALADDLCGNTNGARLPRPARLPAQNRSPRATPHRTRSPRPLAVAPPVEPSARARLPPASPPRVIFPTLSLVPRPSSVLVPRPSFLVPRSSSRIPHPSLLTPRPPSLAPQIGTARRRTGSSARTSSRRRALPKPSTAT